jgi:3-dehydroquinate synthase
LNKNSKVIKVTGVDAYDIVIGRALLADVVASVGSKATKVLIVHQTALQASADLLSDSLRAAGYEPVQAGVPDGEDAKRVEVAAWCWGLMGQADFTRTDVVIGFGGGAATDLAGFVAATWMRGVALIHVPTTLLGMVDASVGGKTGINTSEGKNLVGAFYAPQAVFCDLDTLATLPRNELLAGFGEVVKYGFIADAQILKLLENNLEAATDVNSEEFFEIVERCVAIKARVVSEDFKETGLREILNYGHTLGHALELTERYSWRHGAAVSVGMMFAAELARLAGRLSEDNVDRHRRILESLGLPTKYRADKWQQLLGAMQRDKKSRAGTLRFVVLDAVEKPTIMAAPTTEMLFAAYQEIAD